MSSHMDNSLFNSSDFSYNDTEIEYEVVEPCTYQNNHRVELVVGQYVHSIICILGFLGNSLVIVTFACYKKTRSMTDVYLLNVAIADLLFVVSLPLIVYNELSFWSMGRVACKLLHGSYSINLYSGMLLLACISTDRYIAIVQARRSSRLRSLHRSRIICVAVWSFALLLSVPTLCFYERYQPSHTGDVVWYEGVETNVSSAYDWLDGKTTSADPQFICGFRFANEPTAWTVKMAVPSAQLAVGFFLPLVVMTFCYSAIVVRLLSVRNFQRHKAVRVVLAVVLVFLLCHLPYNVVLFYDTLNIFRQQVCEASDTLQVAKTVTQTVAYLHCCLNPLLYAFVGVRFRNHFWRILRDLWCVAKRSMSAPGRFSRATSEIYVSARRSVDGSSDNAASFTM